MVTTFLIPLGQQFYVGGVHLFVYRLLILLAFIRVLTSSGGQKSLYAGGWLSIDTAFTCYVLISAIATLLQYPSGAAFVNQVGYIWDYLLGYLLLRALIRNEQDSYLVIKCCAALMAMLAVAMVIEQAKMVNVFGLLGGVAAVPEVREGKIRSQGVFQHCFDGGYVRSYRASAFLPVVETPEVKVAGNCGRCGCHCNDAYYPNQHVPYNVWVCHLWDLFLAHAQEDEERMLGIAGRCDWTASGDEGASVVPDRTY